VQAAIGGKPHHPSPFSFLFLPSQHTTTLTSHFPSSISSTFYLLSRFSSLWSLGISSIYPPILLAFYWFLCLYNGYSCYFPPPSTEFFVIFGKGFRFNFSDLDLHSSANYYKTRTSPPGSLASPASTDGLQFLYRRLLPGAWLARSRAFLILAGAWPPHLIPPLPTTSATGGSGRNRCFLLLRGLLSAARVPHAPSRTAPTAPPPTGRLLLLFMCLFFCCFFGLICCIPLPQFTPVFVFGFL
jgi:hypothetical protein